MKITVCELANDPEGLASDWAGLVHHVRRESSELVLLPELPFHPWPFAKRKFDEAEWAKLVDAHEKFALRLKELAPAAVLGTRPVVSGGRRVNQSFAWTRKDGLKGIHAKYYLPDEEGFWEASWYSKGDQDFRTFRVREAKAGFLICTEMWSMPHAMAYGKAGAHIIATPRATEKATVEKWLAGGRACAVVSGCYSLSSNRMSRLGGSGNLGGLSWVVDPDGKVLGTTSGSQPFLTVDIDIENAAKSKKTYPRYSIFEGKALRGTLE